VACDAPCRQLDRARDFFQGLHRRVLHLAVLPGDAAAFCEAILGIDLGIVVVHHELDPNAHRAFLPRLCQENHVAIERHVLPLQEQHHHHRGRDIVLVVHGAAPVHVSAVTHAAERRMGPFLRVHIHRVGVRHDQQGASGAAALQSRHKVWPMAF
jgi:hypothetical protein